jgi:hypothetical protein
MTSGPSIVDVVCIQTTPEKVYDAGMDPELTKHQPTPMTTRRRGGGNAQ